MLAGSRKWTCVGSMKPSGRTTPKENICPCLFRMKDKGGGGGGRWQSSRDEVKSSEVMIGAVGWCWQIPKQTTQRL